MRNDTFRYEHILYTIVIMLYTKASVWRPAVLPARPRVYSLLAAMVGTLLWHHTASLVLHHPSSTETTCTRTLCNLSKLASINFYVAHVIVYKKKKFTDVHNAALLLTELLHTFLTVVQTHLQHTVVCSQWKRCYNCHKWTDRLYRRNWTSSPEDTEGENSGVSQHRTLYVGIFLHYKPRTHIAS